jgi:hypothetical protein
MNWQLTEEQQALKQEFDNFFREEMNNAPPLGQRGRTGGHARQ